MAEKKADWSRVLLIGEILRSLEEDCLLSSDKARFPRLRFRRESPMSYIQATWSPTA